MRRNGATVERRRGRGTSKRRPGWGQPLRPMVMALEDRCLLSTFTVNNPTDTPVAGETDLRQAIADATMTSGASTINFLSPVFNTPQTITLDGSPLTLSDKSASLTITGPAAGLTISGGGKSQVFQFDELVSTSISGLTITGGSTTGEGGGIYTSNYVTATLTNCTISGNSAGTKGGGVVVNFDSSVQLTDCTVSGNSAGAVGGGIYLSTNGTADLTNCTVSGNSAGTKGGGIANSSAGVTVDIGNTIVATNTATTGPDVYGGFVSSGHNLIGKTDGSTGFTASGDKTGTIASPKIPLLAPLANYGGPTETMALLPGSPAIGAGSASLVGLSVPTTDQRGFGLDSPTLDIGAFQTNPLVVNTTVDGSASPFGDLSLRQAVNLADLQSAAETITFDATVFATAQTITLAGSELALSDTGGTQTITGPTAGVTVSGGGTSAVFLIDPSVKASISGLTITDGSAPGGSAPRNGGGVYNKGTLTLTNCMVSGNSAEYRGGGLFNDGTLTLTNCTVAGNSATTGGGGGLFSNGTATVTNCTVAGNSASARGGGLFNYGGTLTVTNCTVAGNSASSGGGILNNSTSATTLGNTIVATNTAAAGPDVDGTFADQGYNLIGKIDGSTGFTATGDETGTIASPLNPDLGTLGNYGGPTQTIPILPGSPAIGAGGDAITGLTIPTTDQRGLIRGTTVDIGAFQTSLVVESTLGSGSEIASVLTLPGAVNLANAYPGPIAISFDPVVFATTQTISGVGTLVLDNTGGLQTITGPAAGVIVSGGGPVETFQIGQTLGPATKVSISGLTITGGHFSGIIVYLFSAVTLTNCTVSGNTAPFWGGGIDNEGTATITDCTVAANSAGYGGGIYNEGTATLTNCTISGNSATTTNGGGIDNEGTVTLTNCTVAGNAAPSQGGGLFNRATATLTNCTVAGNSAKTGGGGIFNTSGSTATLGNTILATNTATTGPDVDGTFTSKGYNLIGKTDGSTGFTVNGDKTGTKANPLNPDLGTLGNYGGPTQTIPLLSGSPAIGKGSSSIAGLTVPTTDQRGFALDLPNPDIGAWQTSSLLVVNTTTGSTITPFGDLSLPLAVELADQESAAETISFSATVFATAQTITLAGSELTLSDTGGTQTITGPTAGVTVSGGGTSTVFLIDPSVKASISGLTITGGSATKNGGGVYNKGTLTLTNCMVSGNSAEYRGGGLYSHGTLTLTDCTVAGNSATTGGGGGIFSDGTATVTNCTVAGNSASARGGGLFNYGGTLTVTNCTIAGNSGSSGGGIYNNSTSKTTLGNTIVATNTATTGPDVNGTFTSKGYNLIGKTDGSTGFTTTGDLTGTIASPLNPDLGILGNYGGPTQTIPILFGSPAIGAGSNSIAGLTIPTTDQRGLIRGTAADIGAFQTSVVVESNGNSAVTTASGMTLPGAISLANTYANTQLTFASSVTSITLGGSELAFANSLGETRITGSGVTVSGGGKSTVFAIDSGVTALISGLTITGGSTAGFGAGILNEGTVTLTNCNVAGNSASSSGGGLYNSSSATLTLTSSTVSGNTASMNGGGLYNKGTLTLTNSMVSGNTAKANGGGLYNNGTITLMTNSTVSGNTTSKNGGGLYNNGVITLMTNSTVSGNFATSGGGLYNQSAGSTTLTDCTVAANSASSEGGGVFSKGTATLIDCTVAANSASSEGGGVYNEGTLALTNCTVAGNSASGGGGILNKSTSTATLGNTIVATNTAATGPDVDGPLPPRGTT